MKSNETPPQKPQIVPLEPCVAENRSIHLHISSAYCARFEPFRRTRTVLLNRHINSAYEPYIHATRVPKVRAIKFESFWVIVLLDYSSL